VGAFLRRSSLDELPQLINVLKGEMSLIGPRPMLLSQRALYGASLDAYERMRPGLTGLWQVNGRNKTTFEERARLDDWYARNWSLWRDGVILLRTVRELVFAAGR
jgi:undecaprenyl-phosphate galactose phosphotransferase